MEATPPGANGRSLAAVGLIAAPALLLLADLLQVANGSPVYWPLIMAISFLLFIPAVLTLADLLREHASRLGSTGAALCIVGLFAGSAMMFAFRLVAVVEAGDTEIPPEALAEVLSHPALLPSTFALGPLFPLGMLIIGLGMLKSPAIPRRVALLVVVGAPLFPLGRIAGIPVSFLAGDVVWTLALGWIAYRLASRGRAVGFGSAGGGG